MEPGLKMIVPFIILGLLVGCSNSSSTDAESDSDSGLPADTGTDSNDVISDTGDTESEILYDTEIPEQEVINYVDIIDILILADGATYVVGRYRGSITLGEGEREITLEADDERDHGFLARFGVDGDLDWAKEAPWIDRTRPTAVELSDGALLLGTEIFEPHQLGEGTDQVAISPVGSRSLVAIVYEADGSLRYARRLTGEASGATKFILGHSLSDGSAVMQVYFEGDLVLDDGTSSIPLSTDSYQHFYFRLMGEGQIAWVHTGQPGQNIRSLFALPDDTIVETSDVAGTVTLGAGTNTHTINAPHATVLATYGADGTFLSALDLGWGLQPTLLGKRQDNSFVLFGKFIEDHQLGRNGTTVTLPTGLQNSWFLASYAADGALEWAQHPCEACGWLAEVSDLQLDSSGAVLIAGTTLEVAEIGTSPPITTREAGAGYVVSFDRNGNTNWLWDMHQMVPYELGLDSTGGVTIDGAYSKPLAFPASGEEHIAVPVGFSDVFIATLQSDGGTRSLLTAKGAGSDGVIASRVLADDSRLLFGHYHGSSLRMGTGPAAEELAGSHPGQWFLSRSTADGSPVFLRHAFHTGGPVEISSDELFHCADGITSPQEAFPYGNPWLVSAHLKEFRQRAVAMVDPACLSTCAPVPPDTFCVTASCTTSDNHVIQYTYTRSATDDAGGMGYSRVDDEQISATPVVADDSPWQALAVHVQGDGFYTPTDAGRNWTTAYEVEWLGSLRPDWPDDFVGGGSVVSHSSEHFSGASSSWTHDSCDLFSEVENEFGGAIRKTTTVVLNDDTLVLLDDLEEDEIIATLNGECVGTVNEHSWTLRGPCQP